jgi:hypothetical protein
LAQQKNSFFGGTFSKEKGEFVSEYSFLKTLLRMVNTPYKEVCGY